MAIQKRNDELVDILTPDFVRRDNPRGFWQTLQVIPAGIELVIPANYVVTVAEFEIADGATLEIAEDGVLMVIG